MRYHCYGNSCCFITLLIQTIFPVAGSSKREISGKGKRSTSHATQPPKRQRTLTGSFKSTFPLFIFSCLSSQELFIC